MSDAGSITVWIRNLKAGDESALFAIYERYRLYLIGLAGEKIPKRHRRTSDEEDVLQEAFLDFFKTLKEDKFPRLENRHHLMALLSVITVRKAINMVQYHTGQKRGGGEAQGESALHMLSHSGTALGGPGQIEGHWRSPEEEAILKESYEKYLERLGEELRPLAEMYLAGYQQKEMAVAFDLTTRSIRRKIDLILGKWRQMAAAEDAA